MTPIQVDRDGKPIDHLWLRLVLLAGVAMVVGTFAASLARYPAILAMYPRQAPVFLGFLAVLMGIYGWMALSKTRARSRAEDLALRHGIGWGIVVGLLWIAEIWAGNIAQPAPGLEALVVHGLIYRGAILAVPLVTAAGAGIVAARARSWQAGVWTGLWSGAISALMVFACFLALGLLSPVGQPDPQTLAQFQRSGFTDFAAYSTAESLTAMINHLWIGPGLGLACGLFGGAVGGGLSSGLTRGDQPQPPEDRRGGPLEARLGDARP